MSRRGRAVHRVDLTAKALIARAKELGFSYLPMNNGVVDGLLKHPDGEMFLVVWGPEPEGWRAGATEG